MIDRCLATAALALAFTAGAPADAQTDFDAVEIKAEQVAPGVAVLFGAGGNIGVGYGADGTVLVDDQFAPLTAKIEAAVAALGANPAKFVINTHWHFDHAGGNENLGKRGATIFAHDNVRVRLAAGGSPAGQSVPPAPPVALPVVTYDRGLTMHLNGDTMDVRFLGGGHTDGDSVVHWREKNVVHMGDLYFNIPGWPFIDVSSGGDIEKALFSIDTALGMMDDQTRVIPGHGPLSNKVELTAYRNVLGEALTRIRALKDTGITLDAARAKKPLGDIDRGEGGFIDADAFVGAVWASLD